MESMFSPFDHFLRAVKIALLAKFSHNPTGTQVEVEFAIQRNPRRHEHDFLWDQRLILSRTGVISLLRCACM